MGVDKILNKFALFPEKPKSTIFDHYPTNRDNIYRTGDVWLEGKRNDDRAEGLWRIHDSLYDLTDFAPKHPGGREWITMTKGTDITEAFEVHHFSDTARSIIPKYFIRKAASPRNSPFTFKENGFYKTLQREVKKKLPTIPKRVVWKSKFIADFLATSYLVAAFLAVYYNSFAIATLSAACLTLTATAAHNFFHQRDNWRMYYFNFSGMQAREWRISHAISHHLYTNTVKDMEVSMVEPFFSFLPIKKPLHIKYFSWIYGPFLYSMGFLAHMVRTLLYKGKHINVDYFIPYVVPIFLSVLTGKAMTQYLVIYIYILMASSIHFAIVGLTAAHHHPEIFHDGDCPRPKEELDWGVFQLDAVADRKDVTGNLFRVLTSFGDHALHHLFPTLDHAKLDYLYPTFLEVCDKFGVDWKLQNSMQLVKGHYLQIARDVPNKTPPRPMKNVCL